jgi:hypothetical protein
MPNGAKAEVDTLGRVTLIFLNIRKTFLWGRLRNLWSADISRLPTLVPTHGVLHQHYAYGREDLIRALLHILDVYRPTLVRTMDPDPDLQRHSRLYPRKTDFGDLSDHEDHIATAHFTWAALGRWQGPGGGAHWTAESYRGYYNCRWPFNLSIPAWEAKRGILYYYDGTYPSSLNGCHDPAGCADESVRGRVTGTGWGQSTHHRYESTAPWLLRGRDGGLRAFAVLDGQAAMWKDVAGPPAHLGGGRLLPALTALLGTDGGFRLAGLRIDQLGAGGHDTRRSVVLTRQTGPDGPFTRWANLGSPDAGPDRRHTGVPLLALDGTGNVLVFTRTATRGLAMHDGSTWRDLGGGPIQEGACAVTTFDGRIEVFGAGQSALLHWYQDSPNGAFTAGSTEMPAPGSPPQAVRCADGTLIVVYRLPRTAEVVAFTRPPGAVDFEPEPHHLGGQGGFGAMSALLLPGEPESLLLLQRNDAGALSATRAPTVRLTDARAGWTSFGGWFVQAPAAAVDAGGRVVVARLTPAARLATTIL